MSKWKKHKIGECDVVVSTDDIDGRKVLHLSISHLDRYPTWDEIREARDRCLPKHKTFIMYLPTDDEYVNLHENCFHLWEDKNGRV